MEENRWLKEHSPYRRHRSKKQQFFRSVCCGMRPESTTLQLRHDHPETGEDVWFPLHRCKRCGSRDIFLEEKGETAGFLAEIPDTGRKGGGRTEISGFFP